MTWPDPYTITGLTLFDRPNLDDQVLSGTITFLDGTVVQVPTLANDGTATPIKMDRAITTTQLLFKVDSASSSTQNVGLMELQVFGYLASSASSSSIPVSSSASSSVAASSSKAVSSSIASSTSMSSAAPQPTAAADGGLSNNIAGLASVSSSSLARGSSNFAAIDGVILGYPTNETAEWVTASQGVGAWIKLTWPKPYSISAITLFDRPNKDE